MQAIVLSFQGISFVSLVQLNRFASHQLILLYKIRLTILKVIMPEVPLNMAKKTVPNPPCPI